MTLVKCPNGHYYDSSRFGNNCPHCGMSGAASIGADQTTVPLNIPDAPQPANEVTEPLTVSQPVVSQPANVTARITACIRAATLLVVRLRWMFAFWEIIRCLAARMRS